MTYSGLLMMVMCSAAARLLFERLDRIWTALIMPALIVAVVLTFSRNAWVGGCVGIGVLLMLKDFRLLALAPVAAGLFFALAPGDPSSPASTRLSTCATRRCAIAWRCTRRASRS